MSETIQAPGPSLAQCEEVIQRGIGTFIEVGSALMRIRDGRLYKESHDTFEAYCKERWGMSPRHANRLVESADVVMSLGPIGPKPTSEAVARPLASLPPEKREEVWNKALEIGAGKPTAKQVEQAKAEVIEPAPPTETREEFLSRMGVKDIPKLEEEPQKDSPTLWSLKFNWKKARKRERAEFLNWVIEMKFKDHWPAEAA